MPDPHRIDRRQFAGSLAAASCVVATALAPSGHATAADKPAADPAKEAPQADASEKPVPPSEELLLLTYLMQRYPSEHFEDAALQGIFRDLRGDLARGRLLSAFPLNNSDEPSFVFRAYRAPQLPQTEQSQTPLQPVK